MSHMETASSPRLTDSQIMGVQRPPTRNWSQLIIAAGVVLFFCYTAELVLAVLLLSVLLAFILSPVTAFFQTLRLPRSLASAIAVVLLLTLVCVATYVSYSQATSFVQDLPKYSGKIREELARLRSHIEQFRAALEIDGEVGKRLDFLLQELNREANTVLAKSSDVSIKDAALAIKAEVEKLREQVQNVE